MLVYKDVISGKCLPHVFVLDLAKIFIQQQQQQQQQQQTILISIFRE
jgi:hypothetical protein